MDYIREGKKPLLDEIEDNLVVKYRDHNNRNDLDREDDQVK